MSFREKQRIEKCIEILNKIAMFVYCIVAIEIACYICNIKIFDFRFRDISIEKYALCVLFTAVVGYGFKKLSDKIKDEFVKKLKHSR